MYQSLLRARSIVPWSSQARSARAVRYLAYESSVQQYLTSFIIFTAPLALRAAKMAIMRAPDVPIETGLDFERACYEPLLRSQDRVEALNAFKEKRPPVFKGE